MMPTDTAKRIPKGQVHLLEERCKGCGFCIEFCPQRVLAQSPGFNEKGYHPPMVLGDKECVQCGMCTLICPEFAIFTTPEGADEAALASLWKWPRLSAVLTSGESQPQKPAVLTGEHFMSGDHACAEGAIAAGCRFFAGYPITPATEIAERMAERLPEAGGVYIQMEDEIASMAAILGASWGGLKTMTATSGPGFSLMMENIGLGIMTETPCVIVDVQRAGPSTGLPTLVGQGDMMQARWGSHGPYEIIALCPNSPQELFSLTIRAFNLAERFRLPVLVMTDAEVGHMTERVSIPPASEIEIKHRKRPSCLPGEFATYRPEEDLIPPMPDAGWGYRLCVESLTHDERGYPAIDAEAQEALIQRLIRKIRDHEDEILDYEECDVDGADVVVMAYGISARVADYAVSLARQQGIQAGLFRPITIWPFPEVRIRQIASHVRGLIVPELNWGQMVREVERCAGSDVKVVPIPHAGGDIHDPEEILQAIQEIVSR